MKQVSLNKITLPEDCLTLGKVPSKPKSVVFTNRYLYTTKQQRIRQAAPKMPSRVIHMDIFLSPESNSIGPSLTNSFPVRRTNTNPHKIMYKHRHPKTVYSAKEPLFNFRIEDASTDFCDPQWKLSQSARMSCTCRPKRGLLSQSWTNFGKKDSFRESVVEGSSRHRSKASESLDSMKIDGWNTMPMIVTSKDGLC